jgi:YD repeat-containing protein
VSNCDPRSQTPTNRWRRHALANDYGHLNRIDSANGNSLVLKYDFFGRIIQAFTADGRFVQYEYDDYGDLVTVILPDFSQ